MIALALIIWLLLIVAGAYVPNTRCPVMPSHLIFEVTGKSYRDKQHAWCTPIYVWVWTEEEPWMFFHWKVTFFFKPFLGGS